MNAGGLGAALRALVPWLRALLLGAALGILIAGAQHAGVWRALLALEAQLSARASPLGLPMLLLALRVAWLWVRALRTRLGVGDLGRSVRPELARLGPAFGVLGVVGTLWQLDLALGALERDTLSARLPVLFPTLFPALWGLALQLATRGVAAHAPTWSLARVTRSGDRELYRLDRALLGEGESGLAALLDALGARPPEALYLDLDALLPAERCELLHARIARGVDGPVELAPPLPGMLAPLEVALA